MNVIHSYNWNITCQEFCYFRTVKVYAGNDNTVYIPVFAMLVVRNFFLTNLAVNKGDIIPLFFSFHLKTFQYGCKVFMSEATVSLIYKKNTNIIAFIGF